MSITWNTLATTSKNWDLPFNIEDGNFCSNKIMVCFSSYFQIYISKLFNDQTYMHIMFNPSFRTSLPHHQKIYIYIFCYISNGLRWKCKFLLWSRCNHLQLDNNVLTMEDISKSMTSTFWCLTWHCSMFDYSYYLNDIFSFKSFQNGFFKVKTWVLEKGALEC
jgi:hypothetical protein